MVTLSKFISPFIATPIPLSKWVSSLYDLSISKGAVQCAKTISLDNGSILEGLAWNDGLLVNGNAVVAGTSAKKAPTKIETVRHALFIEEDEKQEMVQAIDGVASFEITGVGRLM